MHNTEPAPPRVLRWLEDDRRFWLIVAWVVGILAFAKGVRPPSDWALTQTGVDYSFGFVKRGLHGALLHALGMHHSRPIGFVLLAEQLLFVTLLALLVRKSCLNRVFGDAAVSALFLGSFAMTYLAHLIGYIDIINGAFCIALLLIRKASARFAASLILVPIALLLHESFLLIFLPVVLLSFLYDATSMSRREARPLFVYCAVLAVVSLAITLATSLGRNMSEPQIATMMARVHAQSNFTVRDDFFETMRYSLKDNVRIMLQMFLHSPMWRRIMLVNTIVLAPTVLLLLHFLRRLLRGIAWQNEGLSKQLRAAIVLVLLAPLSMHLLGWDQARWNSLAVLNLFLVLLLTARLLKDIPPPIATWEKNAVTLVLLISMASGWGLMDGKTVTPYPFYPKIFTLEPAGAL